LICSIDCPMAATSRAIDWSNCVKSGDRPAGSAKRRQRHRCRLPASIR
jgi:hypothetical protein